MHPTHVSIHTQAFIHHTHSCKHNKEKINSEPKGGLDGLADKGTHAQAWKSELHSWIPQGDSRELILKSWVFSDLHMCINAWRLQHRNIYAWVHIHTYTHTRVLEALASYHQESRLRRTLHFTQSFHTHNLISEEERALNLKISSSTHTPKFICVWFICYKMAQRPTKTRTQVPIGKLASSNDGCSGQERAGSSGACLCRSCRLGCRTERLEMRN